jgi:orotidine-5'-phosphate decarboxylase
VTKNELINLIRNKRSFLCTGIDPEIDKLPIHLPKTLEAMLMFNKQIIKATLPYSVAYKLNTAFFEQYGSRGWEILEQTREAIPDEVFVIADAKRGDIGNTSTMYAKAFFDKMNVDAITVSPYMGEDSLRPFLEFENKWVICLALTSNSGAKDFQFLETEGKRLYEKIIETVSKWGSDKNLMFVTGATKAEELIQIRKLIPKHFLLIPGVGAQGGSLSEVSKNGITSEGGILVNSSRGIMYAGKGEDYIEKAAESASFIQQEMEPWTDALSGN